jgi:16S rRNA (guanine527-N7)-methyltransferase
VTNVDFQRLLADRARLNGVSVPPELVTRLIVYFELLAAWNRKMNLAGFSLDPPSEQAVDRLFVEPLLVAPALSHGGAMVDLGSGGGSPAIPLALALSPTALTLVEARARKAVFLKEALRLVQLSNLADVQNRRFEDLALVEGFAARFDLLTVRAVRLDDEAIAAMNWLLRPGGTAVLFVRSTLAERGFRGLLLERKVPLIDAGDCAAVFTRQ